MNTFSRDPFNDVSPEPMRRSAINETLKKPFKAADRSTGVPVSGCNRYGAALVEESPRQGASFRKRS
jgi:hypothetical protein